MISVDHLHLHGFILPFTNMMKDLVTYGERLLTSPEDLIRKL
jgi:hypothetical protein